MWVKQCHKPPSSEWFLPPAKNGDEIEGWIELLFYPYFGREHWQVR